MAELTKKDKKIARAAIDKGLYLEFEKGLSDFENILKDWRNNKVDTSDTYHTLYGEVRQFDKHIARRYDGLSGSHYNSTVCALFFEGWITDADLEGISDSFRQDINNFMSINKSRE